MTWARITTEARELAAQERKQRNIASLLLPSRAVSRGTYAKADATQADPKTEAKRNAALLEMARGRECLLRIPHVCTNDQRTTVAAHSNFAEHGKSKGRKADDMYSCFSCAACHSWLDIGRASRETKHAAFLRAHLEQVTAWRLIAADESEPERFRRAAKWALEQLDSTLLDTLDAARRAGL